jgi:tetratricopeptide (TPR) repeat protein
VKLGFVQYRRGEAAEAEECYRAAVEVLEELYGPEHREVGWALTNRGLALRRLGETEKDRECQQRAHKIFVATYGEDDPQTQLVAGRLAGGEL